MPRRARTPDKPRTGLLLTRLSLALDRFDALTDALTQYGQETLGCRTISPPWLSFYIDGCEQQVHADVPQGPLAYVLSLTRWDERSFTGGETTIMQPHVLDYWHACSL